ncbi:heptaprenyl diphosphate synthase component 1 [Bacillus sp. NEB1478]|uniref:heptaprenyl diphosphate synthase component 1 n=1 Tax=Bacillus sp. NEB1478 TaxID=3073816 RepID=UPI002872E337|nr:heptaprenyl diphosphate synthase component 1 [Bacillus sp. NEB1478]WNB93719.1 heptaprenyl diphosphate synthase component 1 [Bacillus sp. NEB1478]
MNTMEHIQRLKQHTLLLMQHSYVSEYIPLPALNEAKVFITYCLLQELEMEEAVETEIFSSILMIQSALDRHEEILNQEVISNKKKRQLVVLSGDYFSSLYYLLLSRCENLQLISYLSQAVQKINEHKTMLHNQNSKQHSGLEFIEIVGQIESLLYTKAAESLGLQKYIPFIERYLLLSHYQNNRMRNSLNEKQSAYLKKCETDIKEKNVEIPKLVERENGSMHEEIENDLMLGEG